MLSKMLPKRDERGFTMVEVIAAMVIFGILSAIAIPIFLNQEKKGMENSIRSMFATASISLQQEKTGNNGRYPVSGSSLPEDVTVPNDVTVDYTANQDRTVYCLEASGPGVRLYLSSGTPNGTTDPVQTISTTRCTISSTGPSKPVVSGNISTLNEPSLTWNAVPNAARYNIKANGTSVRIVTTTNWKGAAIDAEQKYTVTAIDANNNTSPESNTVTLRPAKSRPINAPQLEMIKVVSNNMTTTGTLTWNAIPWAEQYKLYNADTGDVVWTGAETSVDISANIGERLNVYVVAINDVGVSPQSNTVSLSGPLPSAPVISGVATPGTTGVTTQITWSSIPGASSYNLYKGGVRIKSGIVSGVTDLTSWNQGNIKYTVIPVTADGREGTASNEITISSAMPLPTAPTWGSAVISGNSINVSWNAAAAYVQSYKVEYRVNGGTWQSKTVPHPTSTTTLPITAGQTVDIRIYSVNYTGSSPASIVRSVTAEVPKPTSLTPGQTAVERSALTATCSVGTPRYRYRDDAGTPNSFKAWTEYTARTGSSANAAHTGTAWGQATRVQWQVECYVAATQTSSDEFLAWSPTLPVKTIPNPVATGWDTNGPTWNGSAVTLGTRLQVTTTCPAGTTMQSQFRDQLSNWNYWNGWSGWANNASTTRSNWYNSVINWGDTANVQMNLRCASGSVYSAVNGPHGPLGRTASIPAPTGAWVTVSSWRVASWGASCVAGTTPLYWYEKGGAAPLATGWTRGTSVGDEGRAWGSGRQGVEAKCTGNATGAQGPSSFAESWF
jgi:type IV pilus assembly protein PilA